MENSLWKVTDGHKDLATLPYNVEEVMFPRQNLRRDAAFAFRGLEYFLVESSCHALRSLCHMERPQRRTEAVSQPLTLVS